MSDNIILIGMPGCGKSTVGVVLAKTITKGFVDTDLLIQEHEGAPLFKIINEKGLLEFNRIENEVVAELSCSGCVVATGGSVVYGIEAMENLHRLGIVIYLKLSLCEIKKRINNITTRGIAMERGATLDDLYAERTPLYEKHADIIIDCEGKSLEKTVGDIVLSLDSNLFSKS